VFISYDGEHNIYFNNKKFIIIAEESYILITTVLHKEKMKEEINDFY
jgi:hypothetical protein